ncbi:MAG: site-2 protease family protein [Patescibacteria group bacterium]|jgi:Zn-dependent protease
MLLQLLFAEPMLAFTWIAALIIALTIHEFAHAAVGKWRGDDTAEQMGRLTLNPLAHLDPLGLIMLLTLGFGWAKPVPYDPRNLRGSKYDDVMIAFAGPISNIILAAVGGIAFRVAMIADLNVIGTALGPFLVFFVLTNLMLAIFNMIPIHPLDGSKLLTVWLTGTSLEWLATWLLRYGNQLLLGLILISIVTPYDPFSYIQIPSFLLCGQFLGASCGALLGVYFGG